METQNDSFVLGSEEESNHKRAVVVFYGPHYGGVREWGRIDKAIKIAKKHNCPLIICGDGCLGEGVTIFYDYAIGCGVEEVYAHFDSRQNTRGDAFGAVHVIVSRFPTLGRLHLVTDWYHLPRSFIALSIELNKHKLEDRVQITANPVWQRFCEGTQRLRGEIRGCLDYLRNCSQRTYGLPDLLGKPGL